MPKGIVFWTSMFVFVLAAGGIAGWTMSLEEGRFNASRNLHADECPEH